MNRLPATITAVATHGSIAVVDAEAAGCSFTCTLVGAGTADWQPGMRATLLFKETEVALARNLSGLISMRNRIGARVTAIEHGKLLSRVSLEFRGHALASVITTRSVLALQLAVGDEVEGLVKANDMTLAPEDVA